MRVVFHKHKRGLCSWTAYPPKRRPVSAGGGGSTGHNPLPHDLGQLVVERELGLEFGFWGCVAAGASFRTLVRGGRRRTQPGVEVIRTHVSEIDAAEHDFHDHVGRWLRGEATPARAALDEALRAWQSIDEHESIEVDFPLVRADRSGAQRQRHRKRASR
jgi:hypothetical protein